MGGSFRSCSAWEGTNDLPWGRNRLPGGLGAGETIEINYKMIFIQNSCQRFFIHFKSIFH